MEVSNNKLTLLQKQQQVMLQCARDPSFMLKNYGYIQHPKRGKIKFETWNYQDECLYAFRTHRYTIVNKSRQIGLSTIVAGYILWRLVFFADQHIMIMAIKESTSAETFRKVVFLFKNLPRWLQRNTIITDNKRTFELSNGSRLQILPKGADASRSAALSLLVIDEAAHIENMEEIWLASLPSLSTGGDIIALSTPLGAGDNWFYRQFSDGKKFWSQPDAIEQSKSMKQPPFFPLEYSWRVNPERDEQWAVDNLRILGGDKRKFAQEYDCSFLGSSDTFIEPEVLMALKPKLKTPHDVLPFTNEYVFEHCKKYQPYLIGADVALGTASDFSTYQVLGIPGFEQPWIQAAEGECKMPPDLFAERLVEVSARYNDAIIAVERNSIGMGCLTAIVPMLKRLNKLKCLYFEVKDTRRSLWAPWFLVQDFSIEDFDEYYANNQIKLGFVTSVSSRQSGLMVLSTKLRDGSLDMRSERLYGQLLNYKFSSFRRPDHQSGNNDDLILALAIAASVANEYLPSMQDSSSSFDALAMLRLVSTRSVPAGATSNNLTNGSVFEDMGFWTRNGLLS